METSFKHTHEGNRNDRGIWEQSEPEAKTAWTVAEPNGSRLKRPAWMERYAVFTAGR